MTTAIAETVRLAREVPQATRVTGASIALTTVTAEIDRGTTFAAGLFGIEAKARKQIDEQLARRNDEQERLRKIAAHGKRYHLMSTEPLQWRDKKGLPRLAVFSLDSPRFSLRVEGERSGGSMTFKAVVSPKLPELIRACYDDVLAMLEKRARRNRNTVTCSCEFEGLIPDDVREKIRNAQGDFEKIFIIAEPPNFTIDETAIAGDGDPLVVGFDGHQLWLIADFDTTTLEQAAIFTLPRS